MGKNKGRKHHRASSVTPQKTNTRADNIDLTKTDPWAYQAERAKRAQSIGLAPAPKPTPLSPAFSGHKSTISVPRDPNTDPSLVFQRMAAVKNNANRRPSFIGAGRLDSEDTIKKSDENLRDDTPIPGKEGVKDKKKKKAKEDKIKEKPIKPVDEAEEAKRKEKKKKVKAEMEQQTARAIEGMQAAAGVAVNESRKRKRDDDDGDEFQRRVEVEANAVKQLRDTLPQFTLERVSRALERDDGTKPTEMTVLLTAARDTVLDLAKAQLFHTQHVSNVVQTEMVRIIDAQAKRLKELEGEGREKEKKPASAAKPISTVAETLNDTSSEDSDNDTGDDPEIFEIPKPVANPKIERPASGTAKAHDSLCLPQ